jgi:hypothetical protein
MKNSFFPDKIRHFLINICDISVSWSQIEERKWQSRPFLLSGQILSTDRGGDAYVVNLESTWLELFNDMWVFWVLAKSKSPKSQNFWTPCKTFFRRTVIEWAQVHLVCHQIGVCVIVTYFVSGCIMTSLRCAVSRAQGTIIHQKERKQYNEMFGDTVFNVGNLHCWWR